MGGQTLCKDLDEISYGHMSPRLEHARGGWWLMVEGLDSAAQARV